MNEFNYATITGFIVIAFVLSAFLMILLSAGCITASKNIYIDITSTPIPTPTPSPTPTEAPITPEPTPEAIETLDIEYIDPFASGQRAEREWYKWYRPDVQGLKDMQIGIVVYRHRFLDRYTWWNPSTGNYFTQRPTEGNRFFAVWVHQEMIGTNQTDDPSFWAFDTNSFALQVKDRLAPRGTHNPLVRIKEFDDYTDYYDTVTAPPFGYHIRYTGHNPESGGFLAEKIGVLRMGQGNAIDGFILYEVPKETQLRDLKMLGEFGTFGSAQWTFPVK